MQIRPLVISVHDECGVCVWSCSTICEGECSCVCVCVVRKGESAGNFSSQLNVLERCEVKGGEAWRMSVAFYQERVLLLPKR